MTELEDLEEDLKKLETTEKCEDMRDKIKEKERDLKMRKLRKGWKNLKGMFGQPAFSAL